MTVLVTGAGGFLGERIVSSLAAQGVRRLRLHFRQASGEAKLRALAERLGIDAEFACANLLSRAAMPALLDGVETVVHSAAGLKGAPADMFLNTVVASRNLMDAAAAAKVRRVCLVSSFSVYDTSGLARHAALDEGVGLEFPGTAKGPYGYAKAAQERLVREMAATAGMECVVARPGVIFGPGGGEMSPRVGLGAMGLFFSLGGRNLLPLTYVDNCADAVAVLATAAPSGTVANVVDDDLPSCGQYLRLYRSRVKPLRAVPIPYPLFLLGSRMLVEYHRRSLGQLPAVFTPHVVRSMYRPLRYPNTVLKSLGWQPRVPMPEALDRTMAALKAR